MAHFTVTDRNETGVDLVLITGVHLVFFLCYVSLFFTANKNFFGIGHFPFNQNVRLEFSTTSISEWNNIFQKEDNRARPQFSKQFSRKFSFHSTLLLEFLEFSVKCFALRKFNSSRESSPEISVPFALASIFFERFG